MLAYISTNVKSSKTNKPQNHKIYLKFDCDRALAVLYPFYLYPPVYPLLELAHMRDYPHDPASGETA